MAADKTVAVVTGASRGAGLGIAHALGSHGCTVYVTGRTEKAGQSPLAGTIGETAELVTAAGGEGIAVAVAMPTTSRRRPCSTGSDMNRAASTSW